MGNQSARLYYQGKDHKDIYFHGMYHGKLYKGSQLLWEKLFPNEYFVLLGSYNQGVGVLSKEKRFYDMLPCPYEIYIIGNVGKTLIGCCKRNSDENLIYSIDCGKSWKKLDIPTSFLYILNSFIPSSHSFVFYSYDGVWSIARFDGNGEFINVVQTDYRFFGIKEGEYAYDIVKGYADYYSFYRTSMDSERKFREIHIRNVNQDGVDIGGRTYTSESRYGPINNYPIEELYHAGTSIYGMLGYRSNEYTSTCLARLTENGIITQLQLYDYRLYATRLVYSDSSKTIVDEICLNKNGFSSIARIHVLYSNSYQMVMELEEGYVIVKRKDSGEYAKIYLATGMSYSYGEYYGVIEVSGGSYFYTKNGDVSTSDENGMCFYVDLYMHPDPGEQAIEKRAVIYFDNVCLKESNGNYFEFIN